MTRTPFRLLGAAGLALGVAALPAAAPAPAGAQETAKLQVGDRAPAFPRPLPSTAGEGPGRALLSLDDVLGRKNIVLAFYVADWSGG